MVRKPCEAAPDVLRPQCPTRMVLDLIADKWTTLVIYPEVPPRTEYSLTDLGLTLREPLGALCQWAVQHLPDVEKARKAAERKRAKGQVALSA